MKTFKGDLLMILSAGVINLLFWILPAVFERHLNCSIAEFYLKYRAVFMTGTMLVVLASIRCLFGIKDESLRPENNSDTDEREEP